MKEEILKVLYEDTCLSQKMIIEVSKKLHKAFIQAQIDLLNLIETKYEDVEINGEDYKAIFPEEIASIRASITAKKLEDE